METVTLEITTVSLVRSRSLKRWHHLKPACRAKHSIKDLVIAFIISFNHKQHHCIEDKSYQPTE